MRSKHIKTISINIPQTSQTSTHTQNGCIMLHLSDLHMNGGLWMNRPKESKPAASWFSYVMLQQEWRDPWSSFEMSAFGKSCWVMIWSSRDVTPGNRRNTWHSHSSPMLHAPLPEFSVLFHSFSRRACKCKCSRLASAELKVKSWNRVKHTLKHLH